VRVDAFDRTGAPLRGLKVKVHIERPATESGEIDLALRESTPGVYFGQTSPLSGAWDFSVTAQDDHGHVVGADRRVIAP
jgi:nitrogen fixation protein FixH